MMMIIINMYIYIYRSAVQILKRPAEMKPRYMFCGYTESSQVDEYLTPASFMATRIALVLRILYSVHPRGLSGSDGCVWSPSPRPTKFLSSAKLPSPAHARPERLGAIFHDAWAAWLSSRQ
jgi:hypothetical protein